MNIQDFEDAVYLTSFGTHQGESSKLHRVYALSAKGMLYQVDAADGTVVGQKYILDISFEAVPASE